MKKTMKKLLALLMALSVFAAMICSAHAELLTAQASNDSQRSDALAAYKKVFEQEKITWPRIKGNKKPAEEYSFSLVDVDEDTIPEVFVSAPCSHMEGYVGMMTYRNGKVDFSYADDGMFYYPKKGIVLMAYAQQGWEIDDYYQVKGGKVKHLLHAEWCYKKSERHGNKDRYTDAKNKKLSKSKFKKKLKGYVGKTKKKEIIPKHENTEENREKYFSE